MRHLDTIDFNILICGRICWDEIERVKRVCRLSAIKIPSFMQNMDIYIAQLQEIAEVNKIKLASAPNNGWPTEDELKKTRDDLLDDIMNFNSRTLDYRSIMTSHSKNKGFGDKGIYHVGHCRKLRRSQPPKKGSSFPKPSTREELISELTTANGLKLECDDDTTMFIELDLRHPIANSKDYDNVMRK